MDTKKARISATGTASHIPSTPQIKGKSSKKITRKTNVRKKERIADTFPLDNAVNNAEEKILIPVNKKLSEKIANPCFVI